MFKIISNPSKQDLICAHCGDVCPDEHPVKSDLDFCCNGCEVIFTLLNENGLGDYYHYETNPGISKRDGRQKSFEFLDDPEVVQKLLVFHEGNVAKILLKLPQIHCASCVWLLENIHKLNEGVMASRVNFLKQEAVITFNIEKISLRELVSLLTKIGYEPELNLGKLEEQKYLASDKTLLYKLGLAGFSFGNIMLLSFPEYFGFAESDFRFYLGYINIALSIPVLLYSGKDYLTSAYRTLKFRKLSIDVPIAVGMLTLFFRSTYEILSHTGEGYLDSLAGFVFFLLIGRWFQQFTFQSISFDRDFKSYFPISAHIKIDNIWSTVTLDKLNPGDYLQIRNEEIIPADGAIISGKGKIDYSFVTGESEPVIKSVGDKVFAGGKQSGSNLEICLTKNVDQSYLTKLWDDDSFRMDKDASTQSLINVVGKYFTVTILIIGLLTLAYWMVVDPSLAFNSFTAVLIVACPCALALAIPFTYGNILRILSRRSLFIKNVQAIERIQKVDHIVFDKTGTLTDNQQMTIRSNEYPLTEEHSRLLKTAVGHSNHPVSRALFSYLEGQPYSHCDFFEEITGKGIHAVIDGKTVKVGSADYILTDTEKVNKKGLFVKIGDLPVINFNVENKLREGVAHLVNNLETGYPISILSGDNDKERQRLESIFPSGTKIHFNQSPADKLQYIKNLQADGSTVMMIGDGLNDAGALKQSDIGLVISDESNNFTPACDAIIGADKFSFLLSYLKFLRSSVYLIYGAFILAFLYNTIGLYFAVTGQLSPVIAAILMPLSSVTVMIYGVLSSYFLFHYFMRKSLR
ncbi:MAG: heavy metal translocating P-type ATPase metal-binding domain-containing protein [Saprospiraceae bacterium]|nr:heavy metal translocating P-type ATPase metal-binding domain-containing protein [Saprospiraceae bacterium]